MTESTETATSEEVMERESLAWVNRLLSGAVTPAEADALAAWRAQSSAHERMFAEAVKFRQRVRAAVEAERQNAAAPVSLAQHRPARPRADVSRRALLGGALAASAAGVMVMNPRAPLWTSWAELTSDYRTGTGERRSIVLASDVSLELNTQTNVDLQASEGHPGVKLLSGETEVTARRSSAKPFSIAAGEGRALITQAKINVRADGMSVCITCLEGQADVRHRRGRVNLGAGRQVTYTARAMGEPTTIDPTLVTGWRRGVLIFRDAPLQQVVDELNRYRPGKIVLMDAMLAQRPVYGVFQTDQMGRAVDQVQRLTGVHAVHLPGGVVVLS